MISIGTVLFTVLLIFTAGAFSLPRLFGYEVYAVVSGSMEPQYLTGSIIFTKAVFPEQIQEGDCITYLYGDSTVTHRVLIINGTEDVFITKGDANNAADPPVSFDRLVGKATKLCIPLLGYPAILLRRMRTVYYVFAAFCLVFLISLLHKTPFHGCWRQKRHEKKIKNAH